MHDLEGLFCKTANPWKLAKIAWTGKKHSRAKILLAQHEEGIWKGCSHRALAQVGEAAGQREAGLGVALVSQSD